VAEDEVMIDVSDNGRGFDPAVASQGRGLNNQAHRATAIGGRVEVRSGTTGTRFTLILPIRQPSTSASPADTDIPAGDQARAMDRSFGASVQ